MKNHQYNVENIYFTKWSDIRIYDLHVININKKLIEMEKKSNINSGVPTQLL